MDGFCMRSGQSVDTASHVCAEKSCQVLPIDSFLLLLFRERRQQPHQNCQRETNWSDSNAVMLSFHLTILQEHLVCT
jgi:hypothetical protein